MTKTVKKTFKIVGMDCVSCSMLIDCELESIPGVKTAITSYARQETELEFEVGKVVEDKVLASIQKLGYSVKYGDE